MKCNYKIKIEIDKYFVIITTKFNYTSNACFNFRNTPKFDWFAYMWRSMRFAGKYHPFKDILNCYWSIFFFEIEQMYLHQIFSVIWTTLNNIEEKEFIVCVIQTSYQKFFYYFNFASCKTSVIEIVVTFWFCDLFEIQIN